MSEGPQNDEEVRAGRPADRTQRPPLSRAARAAATWYLAVGVVALVVGTHELVFAVQVTFRVVGAAAVLVGVGLLASSVGFKHRKSWCYSSSVAAGFAAAVIALMFLLAQWVNYASLPRLAVWLSIAAISLIVSAAVAREGRVTFVGLARPRVKIASSLLSVGAVLSIAQFWNAAVRVPPAAAPSVAVDIQLEPLPTQKGFVRLEGALTVRNTSATKIWVLGSLYNLIGGSATHDAKSPKAFSDEIERYVKEEFVTYGASHYMTKSYDGLIESGQFVGDLMYFVPGDEVTYHLAFYIPKGRYDFVRLTASVYIAKDTLALGVIRPEAPHVVVLNHVRRVDAERTVRETSWLGQFLRDARVEHTDVVLDRSSGFLFPYLLAYVDRRRQPVSDGQSPYSTRMTGVYGIGASESSFELALP